MHKEVRNTSLLELVQLVFLNPLDLLSPLFQLLSRLRTFLNRHNTLLFLQLVILRHLNSYAILVLLKEQQSGFLLLFFLLFGNPLLFHDFQELFTLLSRLFFDAILSLPELLNAGIFEAFQKFLALFAGCLLHSAELQLVLLLDLLRFDCIKLSLAIGSLLLHFAKSLDLFLAFLSLTGFLRNQLGFLGVPTLLEFNDILFQSFFT